LDKAEVLCDEAGLDELAVDLLAIRATALLAIDRPTEALAVARRASQAVTPGMERPYLVHHRHSQAAVAAGAPKEAAGAALEAKRLLDRALDGLGIHEMELAFGVPEHREIAAAAIHFLPKVVEVELPAAGTPIGRSLGADDLLNVVWTVEHPDDQRADIAHERRQRQILRLLAEAEQAGAVPTIEHLAKALDVSGSTVRRDLAALRKEGHDVMTRGQRRHVS
ncbi:MAG: helix-turn-helix domain-containing protein, partial [Acidimicrobiia bacterium]